MKVWTAKEGESLRLELADEPDVEVKLIRTKGRKAVVGIEAPPAVRIVLGAGARPKAATAGRRCLHWRRSFAVIHFDGTIAAIGLSANEAERFAESFNEHQPPGEMATVVPVEASYTFNAN